MTTDIIFDKIDADQFVYALYKDIRDLSLLEQEPFYNDYTVILKVADSGYLIDIFDRNDILVCQVKENKTNFDLNFNFYFDAIDVPKWKNEFLYKKIEDVLGQHYGTINLWSSTFNVISSFDYGDGIPEKKSFFSKIKYYIESFYFIIRNLIWLK